MGSLELLVTALVGCAALSVGCGGASTKATAEGGTNGGVTAEAGAGGALPGDMGGGAGVTLEGDAVQQAAERGLAADDVELRAEVLAGHGFTLLSSLCPRSDGWVGEQSGSVEGEARSLDSVHVRAGGDGELELVTLTQAGGVPKVQVAPLRQVGLGFSASEVATCAALVGYEDFETYRYVARDVHLVFQKTARSLTAVVAATADDEPATSQSTPDREPPHLRLLDHFNGALDGVEYRANQRYLYFDEPVVEADLELLGPNDERASWEALREGEFVTGYRVRDELSSDFRIVGTSRDLSGNELSEQRYPGVDSAFSDGNFEGLVALGSSDEFIGQGTPNCDGGVLPSPDASASPLPEVPPIAGGRSLLITPGCTYSLRIPRQPGATNLRFEMQGLEVPSNGDKGELTACVTSLGVGNDDVCTRLSVAESEEPIGPVVTYTATLPDAGDDLWVGLRCEGYCWLDSLRTE